jgi:hypothetical protein
LQSEVENNTLIIDNSNIYYTRTIDSTDSNKLIAINTDGTSISKYPNDSTIGVRIVVKVLNTLKISEYKDSNGYHYITTNPINMFNTTTLASLNLGDKLKGYSIRYNDKVIPFTVLGKNVTDSTVTLISDIIMTKEFDSSEATYVNGNPNWNLSNLKQWLNSDIKIG